MQQRKFAIILHYTIFFDRERYIGIYQYIARF